MIDGAADMKGKQTLAADQQYMARAIQLAKKGQFTTHPNPRVGCVIIKNDAIIGEGFHQRAGEAHAEINALNAVKSAGLDPTQATAYVTLEPCSHHGKTPPCANALIDAGVSRVVIAMQDPNPQVSGNGIRALENAGITVTTGVLEAEANRLNPGFIKRMKTGLPWVRIKMAMSLDGRTAMASGESQWITGEAARQDVQRYRASADAILTGSGTVLADDPSLNVRLNAADLGITGDIRQPLRVIVDSQLQTPTNAKLLGLEGNTLIYTATEDVTKINQLNTANTEVKPLTLVDNKLSLTEVLKDLANKEINEVHVEAGSKLCGALLQQGLVDELIIYMAPSLMGSNAQGLFDIPGLDQMKDKIQLNIKDIRAIGDDFRITALIG